MADKRKRSPVRSWIKWLLLVTAVLFLISGFGISEYRTVETLTFGLFSKTLAFKMHEIIWIPFVVLLLAHVLYSSVSKLFRKT